jgi:hypothetical protein
MRNFSGDLIALLSFETRIIYYPGSEHSTTVEIIVSRPLQTDPPHKEFYSPRLRDSRTTSSSGSSASHLSVESPLESGSNQSNQNNQKDPQHIPSSTKQSIDRFSSSFRKESEGTLKSMHTLSIQSPRKVSDADLSVSGKRPSSSARPPISGFSDDFTGSDE